MLRGKTNGTYKRLHFRFRRERLSLYATAGNRTPSRRSKSVGNTAESRQRQRNGHGPKNVVNGNSDNESKSDSDSEYQEVFKPISQTLVNDFSTYTYENKAFNSDSDLHGGKIDDEKTSITKLNHNGNDADDDDLDGESVGKESEQQMSTVTIETRVTVPETIITDSETGTNQNLMNGGHSVSIDRAKYSNHPIHTPPIKRRFNEENKSTKDSPPSANRTGKTPNSLSATIDLFTSNEISPDDILEHKRKRSNNHLYPPPLDEII